MNVESLKARSNQRNTGNSDKQQNISDKVREIQLRQKNWLKERAAETAGDSDDSSSSSREKLRHGNAGTKVRNTASRQAAGLGSSERSDYEREPLSKAPQKATKFDGREGVWRSGKEEHTGADSRVATCRTEIRSHLCPVCSHLMVAPHHAPMLTVPCGHSMCNRCCRSREHCPVCECYIESSACNVMLQKIVTDHQRHLSSNSVDKRSRQQRTNYDNFSSGEDDLVNARLRCEVLLEEQKSVWSTIRQIDDQIKNERLQMDNIDKEQENINRQIQDLQLRHNTLADHRQQYVDKCLELADRRGNAESKLVLLKSTLVDLQRETDRLAIELPVDDVT